jgi:hypothetical protein
MQAKIPTALYEQHQPHKIAIKIKLKQAEQDRNIYNLMSSIK